MRLNLLRIFWRQRLKLLCHKIRICSVARALDILARRGYALPRQSALKIVVAETVKRLSLNHASPVLTALGDFQAGVRGTHTHDTGARWRR